MPEQPVLHVQRVGEDATAAGTGDVVLLHGLFGQGRNFTQVAKALQPELRSTLVDLPNHGRSAWTSSVDYVLVADTVAAWLRDDLAARGVERTHLVGHSMGGKVAMVLATRHPELVDRLVVVDISPAASGGLGEFEHLLDSLAGLDLDALESRGQADELLAGPIADERVRGFLLQNLRVRDGRFVWQANLALLRAQLDVIGGFPTLDPGFTGPVLWMAGERSPYVQPEHAPEMRRLFPRTTTVTVKGAGHWVHSEAPDAFVSILRHFLLAG
ncbi:alpha/beta fold hydrolase [Nocardioides sp. GY 10127]|uniref:alpha/beta fold hydrolase n=1 Tax=Nocardioides sp. GY 10127 TaxID=2569762 RepID=UPI0010A7D441|nr:alpha/beta fold hydrolase [Nocardioides sp. GY 10127]TIC86463.1 alpha/beta fold hydrolase [Nocardioides sp. GY 10127]